MAEEGYIRGGGGVAVDSRRLGLGLAVGVVLVLAACTVWQALSGAAQNAHADRLRASGVPVEVTVTGCQGISSGIGMGVEFYKCSGTYHLDGATFTELIHGSRTALPATTVVPALVVASDPTTLTRTGPGATALPSGSVGSYAVAIVLGFLTLVGASVLAVWYRRSRHRTAPPGGDGPLRDPAVVAGPAPSTS